LDYGPFLFTKTSLKLFLLIKNSPLTQVGAVAAGPGPEQDREEKQRQKKQQSPVF